MDKRLFEKFRDIAYSRAGIALKDGKETLVSARVAKRLRVLKIPDAKSYLNFLESDESGEELIHFLDAISTNFTSFFREKDHFDFMNQQLREWFKQGQNRLRIWSAAASSGEEPYTIIMSVLEAMEGRKVDFKLLGTDISTRILARAMAGEYEEKTVEPVGKPLRLRYFDKQGRGGDEGMKYKVKAFMKNYVVFKRLNLAKPPFPMQGPLDFVFCRNVMIYFDNTVRQALVGEIERLLRPGGFLFVGHTETLTGIKADFKSIRPSIYQRL